VYLIASCIGLEQGLGIWLGNAVGVRLDGEQIVAVTDLLMSAGVTFDCKR
jgi:hypothetical protein